MSLSKRLQSARKARNLSQEQVAQEIGISREAVQQWEAGKTQPQSSKLVDVASLFGIDLNWLMTGKTGDNSRTNHKELVAKLQNTRMLTIEELDVRAAMARGGAIQGSDDPEVELVTARWQLPSMLVRPLTGAPETALKIITAVGDSNMPEFHPGDRVMVDTSDKNPSPPGFFAIWDGFGEVIKRLEMVPYSDPPRIMLISANPSYEPREVALDEVVINGRILGKWQWK